MGIRQCSTPEERNPDLHLRAYNIDSGGVRARLTIDRMIRDQQGA